MPVELEAELHALGRRLLEEAPPVTAAEIVGIAELAGVVDLSDLPEAGGADGRRGSRLRFAVAAGTVAASTLLVAGLGVIVRPGGDGDRGAVGSSPIDSAQVVAARSQLGWPPRLLLDETWDVSSVDEMTVDEGAQSFTRDAVTIHIGWYRDEDGEPIDHYTTGAEVATATILGEDVPVVRFIWNTATGAPSTALADDRPLELIARFGGGYLSASALGVPVDEFVSALETLHEVEPSAWLDALPETLVTTDVRPAVVQSMLVGVPLPAGFDLGEIADQPLVQTRSLLAERVAQSVSCRWFDQWLVATEDGDDAAIAEAAEAIGSTSTWQIVIEGIGASPDAWRIETDGSIVYVPNDEPLTRELADMLCDPTARG